MPEYRAIAFLVLDSDLAWSYSRSPTPAEGVPFDPAAAKLGIFAAMLAAVLVFFGGLVGSLWRFWWSGLVARRFGETFPFGTLVVNMTASILLGAISGFIAHLADRQLATALQEFLAVGICGGLSTFSSFSLQTWNLLAERRWVAAILNILVSTMLCFAGTALGWQFTGS
jgi:fluoride exporter